MVGVFLRDLVQQQMVRRVFGTSRVAPVRYQFARAVPVDEVQAELQPARPDDLELAFVAAVALIQKRLRNLPGVLHRLAFAAVRRDDGEPEEDEALQ